MQQATHNSNWAKHQVKPNLPCKIKSITYNITNGNKFLSHLFQSLDSGHTEALPWRILIKYISTSVYDFCFFKYGIYFYSFFCWTAKLQGNTQTHTGYQTMVKRQTQEINSSTDTLVYSYTHIFVYVNQIPSQGIAWLEANIVEDTCPRRCTRGQNPKLHSCQVSFFTT